jgi:TetR/AcrR family transcriptional regulator
MKTTQNKPTLTARDQAREESRQSVLIAATDLFSRRGYDAVALDEISAASGIRKNNLLYHFSSKEGLWKEAVDRVFLQVEDYFNAKRGQRVPDSWDSFETYARGYFEACWRFPAYMLIPMIEGVNESWRSDYLAERHLRDHVKDFENYVSELVKNGVIPPVNSIYLQNIFTGGAQSFLALAPLWRKTIDTDTHRPEFIESYVDTLLSLLKAARGVAIST